MKLPVLLPAKHPREVSMICFRATSNLFHFLIFNFHRGGEPAAGEGQRKAGAESRFRHREADGELEEGSWT